MRKLLIGLCSVAFLVGAANLSPAHANYSENFGDSYGYVMVTREDDPWNKYNYWRDYATAVDLKADGRRVCTRLWTSAFDLVADVTCDTTSRYGNTVYSPIGDEYGYFQVCHQTNPNVDDGLLTCNPKQKFAWG